MPMKDKPKLCGSIDTQTRKTCRRKLPCPYHNEDGSRKNKAKTERPNRDILRHEKLLQLRLQGKSLQEAGREAGYSENTLKGKIYKIAESVEHQARIQAHIESAEIQTEEIIGVLISHMRGDIADFFPEDDLLQQAKNRGISHLIKKVKRRPVVAGFDKDENPIFAYETELEIQDQQGAAKHLTKVFDTTNLRSTARKTQRDFDATVDRIMRKAKEAKAGLDDEELRRVIIKKLKPSFPGVVSDSVS